MHLYERTVRFAVIAGFAVLAYYVAGRFGTGGLWQGLGAAHAVSSAPKGDYDLTQLVAVNETLKKIRNKYVDPSRVAPRDMFISALNQVQREVAPIIVTHEDKSRWVKVRVDTEEMKFRVDRVEGPWDVSARLREVFTFLQTNLRGTDVDLRSVEYAACNGMLRTLDPHSNFLSPEAYAEMNLSTSGHFGGLGIVISIEDQMLTIIRPMDGTPAGRAGLKRGDRIAKINNESTLNMPLDDAVKRLRGAPHSNVTIWIVREGKRGWKKARPFELEREQIRIPSVMYQELAPGIGYIRLKQFQSSTSDELDQALARMRNNKEGKARGLVLDLRNNPGGLLDQAAKVADRFLRRGVIVSTVGGSEGRDEKKAGALGTEPNYPIVVLVNGSSASASEIVSGALKNHDRAVLVGQTTFGKGSVQLVFSRIAGGAALKLTIAQYLTPGGISIQGVGVTPDIELDPMTADTLDMDLFRSQSRLRERDLSKSLSNGAVRRDERPWVTLRFNLPESERAIMRAQGRDPDKFRLDFPVRFARDLVAQLPRARRQEQLESVQSFIDKEQSTEIAKVAGDLKRLGIDWQPAPDGDAKGPLSSDYSVHVETSQPENRVMAGEQLSLTVRVKNNSDKAIYRLRAITKSDNGNFNEQELVFGRVGPAEEKSVQVALGFCRIPGRHSRLTPTKGKRECRIPLDSVTRQDVVKIRFSAEGGEPPPNAEVRPTVVQLPQPSFAYTYQIVDDRSGDEDGVIRKGEGVSLYLDVKNVGKGKSRETQARLRNLTGDGLLLRGGRFDISNMAPGETRQVVFTFDVLEQLNKDVAKVEVTIVDRDLRVASSEKISIPISAKALSIAKASGWYSLSADAQVRGTPLSSARVVGTLIKGSTVERTGTHEAFSRVLLADGRFGYVSSDELIAATGKGATDYQPLLTRSPPLLDVAPATLATRSATVRIEGLAIDSDQVRDAYVFVRSQKVFYKSNRKSSAPKQLRFSFEAELSPGINVITVVARENEDIATAQTLVVRRDGPNGEALTTPKRDSFGADWEFTGP